MCIRDSDAGKSLAKLRIAESERPVGIQLYGHLVEPMVEAARIAEAADPDTVSYTHLDVYKRQR